MGELGFRLLILASNGLSLRKQGEMFLFYTTYSEKIQVLTYLVCLIWKRNLKADLPSPLKMK